ncbi:MAG: alpha/beta hydrolase [Verrucomicrobiales bacterium]|nr:alpha/beta hydrolase [Verrucomicrobiales bacterium]
MKNTLLTRLSLLATLIMTTHALLPSPANAQEPARALLWQQAAPYSHGDKDFDQPFVDIYLADEKIRNGAAVVVCPGGGYGGLALDHEGKQIAEFYNTFGVTAFVLHYRLGSHDYHFPTQLADVQRALRLVRSQAETYQIDPHRIGVMGFSAGGHLASMAATKFDEKAYPASDAIDQASARPDFAVLCYPVITMDSEFTHKGSRKNLLGADKNDDPKAAKHVSSELNITDQTPPTFLFHTDQDNAVPAENSVRFYLALRQHKIPAELHIYQKGPHGVGLQAGDPILGTWGGHLKAWLRTNGFLVPKGSPKRVPVSGKVSLNGTPVSWGSITFAPNDPNLPVTSTVVRKGKFQISPDNGPVASPSLISFEASIWDATHQTEDRVIHCDRLSQKDLQPLSLSISSDMKALQFDLTYP